MTWLARGAKGAFVLLSTFCLLRVWFGTPMLIPLDEAVWTFVNDLTGQQRPRLATDLQFVSLCAVALALSILLLFIGTKLFRRIRHNRST